MKPSAAKVLRLLRRAGRMGVTSGEFAEAGILRYSARILELRKLGYLVEQRRLIQRGSRFTLIAEPAVGVGRAATERPQPSRADSNADALLPSRGPRCAVFEWDEAA